MPSGCDPRSSEFDMEQFIRLFAGPATMFTSFPMKKYFSKLKPMHRTGYPNAGRTWTGRSIEMNGKVVVKKGRADKGREESRFLAEISFLIRCKHPNIIPFYGLFRTDEEMLLVLEYTHGGTLSELLRSGIRFKELQISYIFSRVLRGLDYMHERGVVHRNVKPQMFLVGCNGDVKIVDFSYATSVMLAQNKITGTPNYIAPEVFRKLPVCGKADIWSVGICIIECMFGLSKTDLSILQTQMRAYYGISPVRELKGGSSNLKRLLAECLACDPGTRANASEALTMQFFDKEESSKSIQGVVNQMMFQPIVTMYE
eukprot:CAMPEP_0119128426 /NCGR_PEP_ID=MMETSP1310-20130426/6589_1 /TAXON_ID=464262 /ORGANISM="Genus nov. species nov., Strain RCC2339" /LENGTH=313 /DNA_ID=CAMNT_0007118767 /DNA_START=21 /DNA_END=962 /DNA_ORIENTATION=+